MSEHLDDVLIAGAVLSPDQAIRLMAFGVMVRDGDIELSGDDDDVSAARDVLIDVAEEIALQMGAEPGEVQ